MKRDGLADFQRRDVLGGKRHAHAIGTVLRLEIVEGKDAQGDPRASLLAQFMRLDEACHVRVAEFMRQHGRANHFRAELGCGETSGKGSAKHNPERCMPCSQRKPDGADEGARAQPWRRAHR